MKSRAVEIAAVLLGVFVLGVLAGFSSRIKPEPPMPPKIIYSDQLPVFVFEDGRTRVWGGPRDFHVQCTSGVIDSFTIEGSKK